MDLPNGIAHEDVGIHGWVQRLPRNLSLYPELWENALGHMRSMLAHSVAEKNLRTVGNITVLVKYEKRVVLDQRPDWAGGIDPPWFETVECEPGDPDWANAVVMMEVACAPR